MPANGAPRTQRSERSTAAGSATAGIDYREFARDVYSQSGEDGIIAALLERLAKRPDGASSSAPGTGPRPATPPL